MSIYISIVLSANLCLPSSTTHLSKPGCSPTQRHCCRQEVGRTTKEVAEKVVGKPASLEGKRSKMNPRSFYCLTLECALLQFDDQIVCQLQVITSLQGRAASYWQLLRCVSEEIIQESIHPINLSHHFTKLCPLPMKSTVTKFRWGRRRKSERDLELVRVKTFGMFFRVSYSKHETSASFLLVWKNIMVHGGSNLYNDPWKRSFTISTYSISCISHQLCHLLRS